MLLSGGQFDGVRLLSRKTVEAMASNQIGDWHPLWCNYSGDQFGLGVAVRSERGEFDEIESLGVYRRSFARSSRRPSLTDSRPDPNTAPTHMHTIGNQIMESIYIHCRTLGILETHQQSCSGWQWRPSAS